MTRRRAERARRAARRLIVPSLALWASVACTTLLGIDERYALDETRSDAGSGGRASVGPGGAMGVGGALPMEAGGTNGAMGAGGEPGAGGTEPGSAGGEPGAGGLVATGGEPGAGGEPSAGGSGTGVPEAGTDGCAGACPPDPCSPGTYEGTFTGYHQPSLEVIPFIPALGRIAVAGTVSITFGAGTAGKLTVASGRFNGLFDVTGTVPFTSDVTGTLDCARGRFEGTLTNGEGGAVNNFEFAGTATATGDAALGTLDGTWEEEEVTPRVLNARGTGTFRVTRQ